VVLSLRGLGTFVTSIQLEKDKKILKLANPDKEFLNMANFTRILTEEQAPVREEIENRFVYDKKGAAYWILTPQFPQTDPRYKVYDIENKKQISLGEIDLDASAINAKIQRSGRWRYFGSQHRSEEEKKKEKYRFNPADYQTDIFPDFKDLLEQLANPHEKPRRVILIVPEELKTYAHNYPSALQVRIDNPAQFWKESNLVEQLKLYKPTPGYTSQEDVIENFIMMKETANDKRSRPFLFAPLADIALIKRPAPKKGGFILSEKTVSGISLDATQQTEDGAIQAPHFLYLVATEGEQIGLSDFTQKKDPPTFSTLLVGTESEWHQVFDDGDLESKYNLEQKFEVIHLKAPSHEIRKIIYC